MKQSLNVPHSLHKVVRFTAERSNMPTNKLAVEKFGSVRYMNNQPVK